MARESLYQRGLIKRIQERFPGCYVTTDLKDQGLPDILILFGRHWALLECKASARSPRQPNQEHYVNKFNDWSFASFIYPENEEQVLNDLQQTFGSLV